MKRWFSLLLCVLFSAGIWLVHNLSQTYSEIVSVPVVAESNIEGRARRSSSEMTASAMVSTAGFRLLRLGSNSKKPVVVNFDVADLSHTEGDYYHVPVSSLYKYVSDIFGDGVTLESFVSSDLEFKFPKENHKKVPVKPVQIISFKPQYMALGDMSVIPDSVVVYGDPVRLEGIESVLTRPVSHKDIRNSVHGTVRLQAPSGVRLSHKDAVYSLDVTRYVEVSSTVKIVAHNVPVGKKLSVLPSTASVAFRCVFPMSVNPVDRCEFYVDYRDFEQSITGRCVIRCEGLPDGVISYELDPEVCDCTE